MRMRSSFSILFIAAVLATASGCSRENQDWRSAQAADTVEAYDDFAAKHPQSEFAEQARGRVKQLGEERDWERATVADSADAYQQFLTKHPDGKWAQEARVRVENFNVIDGAGAKPAAADAAAPAAAASAATPPAAAPMAGAPAAAGKPAPKTVVAAPVVKAPPPKAAPAAKAAPVPKAATAAPAAKAPAPASAAAGAHLIQLGAFSSESKADAEWKRVSGAFTELKGLTSRVAAAQTAAGKLYRLQVVVPSEERGRVICKALSARKQACVYVRPR